MRVLSLTASSPGLRLRPVLPQLGLLAIVGVALAIRLYRLPELTMFLGDQAGDVLGAQDMLQSGRIPLLGPMVSTGTFHLGPAIYWLLAPFGLASGGDPAVYALASVLADVATIVLLASLGRLLQGWVTGLVAAALWATGELTILFGRFLWNSQLLVPFLLLAMIAMLLVARGRPRWLLVAAPAWVIAWQLHQQVLLVLPAAAIWWAAVRPAVTRRIVLGSIGLALLVEAPFVVHEVTHQLENTRGMLALLGGSGGGAGGQVRPPPIEQLADVAHIATRVIPSDGVLGLVLWGTVALGLGWCLRRLRAPERAGPLAVVLLAATTVLYAAWPGPIDPHYLFVVMPVPMLLAGLGVATATGRSRVAGAVLGAVVLVVAAGSLATSATMLRDQSVTWETLGGHQAVVAAIVAESGGRPFAVQLDTTFVGDLYDAPYRYLLERIAGPRPGRVDLETWLISERGAGEAGPAGARQVVPGVWIGRSDAPALGPELIADPGFASATTGGGAWGPPDPTVTVISDPAGDRMRIPGPGPADRLPDGRSVAQTVPVPPGRYLISYQARSTGAAGSGRVFGQVLDSGGGVVATAPTGAGNWTRENPDWQLASFFVDVPANGARIVIFLRAMGEGVVEYRAVSLRAVTSPPVPGVAVR